MTMKVRMMKTRSDSDLILPEDFTKISKDTRRIRRKRMVEDKEKRLQKPITKDKEHYVRSGPRNLIEDFYLGRINDEDS